MQSGSEPWNGHGGMLAAIFLALALALGGGGSPAPLPEIILESIGALFASLWVLGKLGAPDWRRVPSTAWMICCIVVTVPILQLIPLPPSIWHALPGREVELDALTLIGEQSSWRTWALAPARTLSSLLSLGPPLLLLLMTSALNRKGRIALIQSIALMALVTFALGALQHAAGEDSPLQLYGDMSQALQGFQANQNSTADFLLVALMTGPLLVRASVERRMIPNRGSIVLLISGAAMLTCAISVVLTSSRTGIALLPIPIVSSLYILRPWLRFNWRALLTMLIAAIIALPLAFILALTNPVLARIVARFDSSNFSHELRPQLWHDGLFVAQKYFPFGVGMGDFIPVYIADERLEVIEQQMPNRAHNELIELTTEAGLLGLGALSAVCFLLFRAARTTRAVSEKLSLELVCFASTSLGIFALHSLVDYPFRSLSLASLAGVCAGLLLSPRCKEVISVNGQPSSLSEA